MNDPFNGEESLETACGGVVQDPNGYPSESYKGKRIYFCTSACLRAFEKAPDAFMNGEVEHPKEEE